MSDLVVPAVGPCRWCGQPAHETDASGQPAHPSCTRWAASRPKAAAVLTILHAFPGATVQHTSRDVVDGIAALAAERRSA